MIAGYAVGTDEKAASSREPFIAVDPDGKVLPGLPTLKIHVHAFDSLAAPRGAEEQRTKENLKASPLAFSRGAIRTEENDCRLGHLQLAAAEQGQPGCDG